MQPAKTSLAHRLLCLILSVTLTTLPGCGSNDDNSSGTKSAKTTDVQANSADPDAGKVIEPTDASAQNKGIVLTVIVLGIAASVGAHFVYCILGLWSCNPVASKRSRTLAVGTHHGSGTQAEINKAKQELIAAGFTCNGNTCRKG